MDISSNTHANQDSFKYNIQVLDRALNIFEIIASSETPMTLQQLQTMTGLNRTTIWRILSTMMDRDFIVQLPNTKTYTVSCKACNLFSAAGSNSVALAELARPEMERLRRLSGETILLLVPETIGSRTILQLDSFESVRLKDYTNTVSPLFITSTGFVQLSFMKNEEIEKAFPAVLPSRIEAAGVMQRIDACRRDGYALIIDEFNQGDSGISAPILLNGKLAGILNVAGPTIRFTEERMLSLLPELLKSAGQISHMLSH